ncbi:MAG: hypothetical protein QGG64_09330 [Candidatus Latescibacteria bacterium]|jgi:hypothetical protein|nr:hypothetical protein [Candidatus Latescibacterota bacterium]
MKETDFQTVGIRMLLVVFWIFALPFSADAGKLGATSAGEMPVPVLVTFDNAAFQGNSIPALDWNDVPGAVSYTLEYADNPEFTNSTTIADLTHSQNAFGNAENPAIDGTLSTVRRLDAGQYYWRVKTLGQNVESHFSPADNFVIESGFPMWTIVLMGVIFVGYMAWQVLV